MSAAPTSNPRVGPLLDGADRAATAGRHAEAARLLAEAQSIAPGNAQVLSSLGMLALKTGDKDAARRHLDRAVIADAESALLWFHLALACRSQGDGPGEMSALDKALAIDPRFYLALLQKATLLERQGAIKRAALVFEFFLHCVPPAGLQPPILQDAVTHARNAVAADKAALEAFVQQRLAAVRATHAKAPQQRFDRCLDVLVGRRKIFTPQPTFMHFPHLPAIEFYDRSEFPWLDALEAGAASIRGELLEMLSGSRGGFVPYVDYPDGYPLDQWRELNRSLQWGAYYLLKNGRRQEEHLARFPRTASLLADAPLADVPGQAPTAFFSLLEPRTRIPPHTGVTNTRLVVHLPLIVPQGCGFRVGSETRQWQPGRALVFDDTIEHEAWNDSDSPRAILIIDIWNPFLTEAERALVSAATAACVDFNRA